MLPSSLSIDEAITLIAGSNENVVEKAAAVHINSRIWYPELLSLITAAPRECSGQYVLRAVIPKVLRRRIIPPGAEKFSSAEEALQPTYLTLSTPYFIPPSSTINISFSYNIGSLYIYSIASIPSSLESRKMKGPAKESEWPTLFSAGPPFHNNNNILVAGVSFQSACSFFSSRPLTAYVSHHRRGISREI